MASLSEENSELSTANSSKDKSLLLSLCFLLSIFYKSSSVNLPKSELLLAEAITVIAK